MNDKYWNMLYDHRTNISKYVMLLSDCVCCAISHSRTPLKTPSQNNFFFSLWPCNSNDVNFSLMLLFFCELFTLASVRVNERVQPGGSFNSSSSEAVNQVQCIAYNENICIHTAAIGGEKNIIWSSREREDNIKTKDDDDGVHFSRTRIQYSRKKHSIHCAHTK